MANSWRDWNYILGSNIWLFCEIKSILLNNIERYSNLVYLWSDDKYRSPNIILCCSYVWLSMVTRTLLLVMATIANHVTNIWRITSRTLLRLLSFHEEEFWRMGSNFCDGGWISDKSCCCCCRCACDDALLVWELE